MLTIPRAQIVEKLITSPEGVVFQATFLIFEEFGKVKARLVKAVPVSKPLKSENLCISGSVCESVFTGILSDFSLEPTSYKLFTNSLYFTGAKPRAPSAR